MKKATEIEQALITKLKHIEKLQFGDTAFYEGGSFYIADTALSEKLKVKPQKGESHRESLRLFQEGKTIAEIATERSMAESTIEGHLSQFIATGEVDIYHFLSKEDIEDIRKEMNPEDGLSVSPLKQFFGDRFSYGQLRMAMEWVQQQAKQ